MPPGCPVALAVAFWVGWVLVAVLGVVDQQARTSTVVVILVVLAVLWPVLPWQPVVGARRVLPVAFLLVVLSIGFLGPGSSFLPLLLAALANLTFSLGRTLAIAAAVVDLVAVAVAIVRLERASVAQLVGETLSAAVLCLFAIAMADAVLRARSRRAEAETLLAQVEELTLADERGRMARDMHDSLGHSMTAVKISLDAAGRLNDRGHPERAWAEVEHAGVMVADALDEARRWVRALRPIALDDGIGEQALRDLAESFRGAGIAVVNRVTGDPGRMSSRTQLVVYRVVQESLANAVRHSRATRVEIDLTVTGEGVTVRVADDGTGVPDGAVVTAGGFGLQALGERVEAVGGTFDATAGFSVCASTPL